MVDKIGARLLCVDGIGTAFWAEYGIRPDSLPIRTESGRRIIQALQKLVQKMDGVIVISNTAGSIADDYDPDYDRKEWYRYMGRLDVGYEPDVSIKMYRIGEYIHFILNNNTCALKLGPSQLVDAGKGPSNLPGASRQIRTRSVKRAEALIRRSKGRAQRELSKLGAFIMDRRYFDALVNFLRLSAAKTYGEVQDLVPKDFFLEHPLGIPFEDLKWDAINPRWLMIHNNLQNPLTKKIVLELVRAREYGETPRRFREREFNYKGEIFALLATGDYYGTDGVFVIKKFTKKRKKVEVPFIMNSVYRGMLLTYSWDNPWAALLSDLILFYNSPENPIDWYSLPYLIGDYHPEYWKEKVLDYNGTEITGCAFGDEQGIERILFIQKHMCKKCSKKLTTWEWCVGGYCQSCQKERRSMVRESIKDTEYREKFDTFCSGKFESEITHYLYDHNSLDNPLDAGAGYRVAELLVKEGIEAYPILETRDLECLGRLYKVLAFGDQCDLTGVLFFLEEISSDNADVAESARRNYENMLQQFIKLEHSYEQLRSTIVDKITSRPLRSWGDDEEVEWVDDDPEVKKIKAELDTLARVLQSMNSLRTCADLKTTYKIARFCNGYYFYEKQFTVSEMRYGALAYGHDAGIEGILYYSI